jgi:hypothetical protein
MEIMDELPLTSLGKTVRPYETVWRPSVLFMDRKPNNLAHGF